VSRKKFKENAGLWAVSLVGLLLALGPLSVVMYLTVPGWGSTGSPGRASVLVVLSLCVASGCLWPEEVDLKRFYRAFAWLAVLIVASIGFGALLASTAKPWNPGIESIQPIAISELFGPTALAALVLLCPFLSINTKKTTRLLMGGLVATLVCGPLFCLPTGRPLITKAAPDPNVRHAFVNSNWGLLNAAKAVMPGNTASASRIYDVAGYDSLLSKDTLEMLRAVNAGKDPAPEANGNMMFVKPGFDTARLADAGVTVVETADGQIEQIPGPGRAYTPSGPAKITLDGYDRQTVEAVGPGLLTVKDRNMPGWSAKVDGAPVKVTEGLWRQVFLPAGPHTVEFRYDPPGLRTGLAASAVGALLTALLLLPVRRKQASTQAREPMQGQSDGTADEGSVV